MKEYYKVVKREDNILTSCIMNGEFTNIDIRTEFSRTYSKTKPVSNGFVFELFQQAVNFIETARYWTHKDLEIWTVTVESAHHLRYMNKRIDIQAVRHFCATDYFATNKYCYTCPPRS